MSEFFVNNQSWLGWIGYSIALVAAGKYLESITDNQQEIINALERIEKLLEKKVL